MQGCISITWKMACDGPVSPQVNDLGQKLLLVWMKVTSSLKVQVS